jgi:hypothetical protein
MRQRMKTVLAFALLLAPLELRAADPLGAFRVDPDSERGETSAAITLDPEGNLLAVWSAFANGPEIRVRRFARDGRPIGGPVVNPLGAYPLSVAADATGFTALLTASYQASLARLDRAGAATGDSGTLGSFGATSVVSDRGPGRTVAVGTGFGGGSGLPAGILAFVGNGTQPARGPLVVAPRGEQPDVAMDGAGRFTVVWASSRAYGQRFTAAGTPAGPRFGIGPYEIGSREQSGPRIAASLDGRFAVAWPFGGKLLLRLFGADGASRGGTIEVSDVRSGFLRVAVAMDDAGEVLVAWTALTPDDFLPVIRGRFYDAGGRPAGPPFSIFASHSYFDTFQALSLAGGRDGRFAADWEVESPVTGVHVSARWLPWARPGDAPCRYLRGAFACDLRHDGGTAEVVQRFGGQVGDIPLWGDLEGDGRDHPCVYREGRFLCASEEVEFGAGAAGGDLPLLGDLDGDGRDDPCVFRAGRFLCDTAHDGGTAEVVVLFGRPGDPALLGDLDGDGDDDPCVAEGGRLLCDTAHGGSAGVSLPFPLAAGDVPLLGDLDGDGDDDPCLYRAGRFLCDTAHTGTFGPAISFGGGALSVPLLGNPGGF